MNGNNPFIKKGTLVSVALTMLFIILFAPNLTVQAVPPSLIDFDFSEFATGDVVTTYTKDGVTMNVSVVGCGIDQGMIFDTANPTGGDPDLGTPNSDFSGPGVGTGGNIGSPGANMFPLGNALISSEDGDSSDPDDCAAGSEFEFIFSEVVTINYFLVLDIEGTETFVVTLYDSSNAVIGTFNATGFGDNSFEEFMLNVPGVQRVVVDLGASGGIPGIAVTPGDDILAGLGDYVWRDLNRNGLQDDFVTQDPGYNGLTVELIQGDCPAGPVLQTTTTSTGGPTNSQGYYQFINLTPGDYSVRFIAPTTGNYTDFTTPNVLAPFADFADSDADLITGCSQTVTLPGGAYDPTIDAGLYADPSAISLESIDVLPFTSSMTLFMAAALLLAAITGTILIRRKTRHIS